MRGADDVWHSADGVNWEQLGTGPSYASSTPWAIRHACAVHVHGDALYLAAGNACVYPPEEKAALLASNAKGEYDYKPRAAWSPGDVWRLARRGGPRL